jgi:hypothetical protein
MTEWFGQEGDMFKGMSLLSIKIHLVGKTLKEK